MTLDGTVCMLHATNNNSLHKFSDTINYIIFKQCPFYYIYLPDSESGDEKNQLVF